VILQKISSASSIFRFIQESLVRYFLPGSSRRVIDPKFLRHASRTRVDRASLLGHLSGDLLGESFQPDLREEFRLTSPRRCDMMISVGIQRQRCCSSAAGSPRWPRVPAAPPQARCVGPGSRRPAGWAGGGSRLTSCYDVLVVVLALLADLIRLVTQPSRCRRDGARTHILTGDRVSAVTGTGDPPRRREPEDEPWNPISPWPPPGPFSVTSSPASSHVRDQAHHHPHHHPILCNGAHHHPHHHPCERSGGTASSSYSPAPGEIGHLLARVGQKHTHA